MPWMLPECFSVFLDASHTQVARQAIRWKDEKVLMTCPANDVCWLFPPSSWPCCPFPCLPPPPSTSSSLSLCPLRQYSSQGIAWALPEGSHKCLISEICCISQNSSKVFVTGQTLQGLCLHASGRPHFPTRVTMEHSAASLSELPHLRIKRKEPLGDRYF